MKWVKICPRGHINKRSADKCVHDQCGELLGGIAPTPLEEAEPLPPEAPPPQGPPKGPIETPQDPCEQPGLTPGEVIPTRTAEGMLILQFIRGGRTLNVRSRQIVGRADGSDDHETRVDIPPDAGVDIGTVSRWHCRFDRDGARWSVTPLDPKEMPGSNLKAANPTFLNAERLAVGEPYPVAEGDRLTLSDVEFRITIPGAAP